MQRRLNFCLVFLFSFVSLLHAADKRATPPTASAAPAASPPPALHSLWQVQGKSNIVYLLGSVHVLKASDYPLAAPIESAYSNAQIVVFEADLEKMEQPETQFKMMSKAALPEGETLKDQLSPEVYTAFIKHLEDAGMPPMLFDKMKPSISGVALFLAELQKMGIDPQYGVDRHFATQAKADGKQVMGLETVEFQINMLTDFTRQEGELLIKSLLSEIDTMAKEYMDLITAWKNGDSVELAKLLDRSMRDVPALYKRLVTDRNARWVPQIEELARGQKNAIVVVGAGHLVGDEGVVELLKKKGLKVKQL